MTDRLAHAIATQDWPLAEKLLRRRVAGKRAEARDFYNLAKVLEVGGKYHQSGAWFQKALVADPAHHDARYELARWHVEQGQNTVAWATLGPLFKSGVPVDVDFLSLGAQLALRVGSWEMAETLWLALAPSDERTAALYRIGCETGKLSAQDKIAFQRSHPNPAMHGAKVKTARGTLALRLTADR